MYKVQNIYIYFIKKICKRKQILREIHCTILEERSYKLKKEKDKTRLQNLGKNRLQFKKKMVKVLWTSLKNKITVY